MKLVWMFIMFNWLGGWNTQIKVITFSTSPPFCSSFTREVRLAAITVYCIRFFLTFWFPAVIVWEGRLCVRIFRLFVYVFQVIASIKLGQWPFSINCRGQTYCPIFIVNGTSCSCGSHVWQSELTFTWVCSDVYFIFIVCDLAFHAWLLSLSLFTYEGGFFL